MKVVKCSRGQEGAGGNTQNLSDTVLSNLIQLDLF